METQQAVGQWRFPLWSSRPDHGVVPHAPFTITGPTCDSSDTMFYGAALPVTMAEGDRLYVASAGAYTLSYASSFNGFPPPEVVVVGDSSAAGTRTGTLTSTRTSTRTGPGRATDQTTTPHTLPSSRRP